MAVFDSADCLARVKRLALRPSVDAEMSDDDWYNLLTEAQAYWYGVIAAQVPEVLYGPPTLLTTTDEGLTYDFPPGEYPVGNVEVMESLRGVLLRPGPYWDYGADFTLEGDKIRMCAGRPRTFGDGPYARYAVLPDVIDASNEPVIQPPHARVLLIYRACVLWASQGGLRDPSFYLALEQKAWFGDMNLGGDVGILGMLKSQYFASGQAATPASGGRWWAGIDTGYRTI